MSPTREACVRGALRRVQELAAFCAIKDRVAYVTHLDAVAALLREALGEPGAVARVGRDEERYDVLWAKVYVTGDLAREDPQLVRYAVGGMVADQIRDLLGDRSVNPPAPASSSPASSD